MNFDRGDNTNKNNKVNCNSGEELTINYNGDWNNNKRIWFDAK